MLDRGVSPDIGDPLLSTWRLSWIAHQLPRDPLASVRREHLLSGEEHAGVLGRDARPVADGGAAPVAGRPSAARLQPAAALRIRAVGRGDVPAGPLADAAHRRRRSSPASCSRSCRTATCTTRISSCRWRSGCRSACGRCIARSAADGCATACSPASSWRSRRCRRSTTASSSRPSWSRSGSRC